MIYSLLFCFHPKGRTPVQKVFSCLCLTVSGRGRGTDRHTKGCEFSYLFCWDPFLPLHWPGYFYSGLWNSHIGILALLLIFIVFLCGEIKTWNFLVCYLANVTLILLPLCFLSLELTTLPFTHSNPTSKIFTQVKQCMRLCEIY